MYSAIRKRLDRSNEEGFTLIELIVAMLIISILATIGAQAFYHQRRKGWVAHVHSALRHMAGAENHHIYGGGDGYTMNVDDLVATGFTYNEEYVEPLVLAADAGTFCIQMTSKKDPSIVWHFNSEIGRPKEGAGGPTECGLGSGTGTLVAGEFDDPDGTNGGNGRTDGGGGGGPEDGTDHDGSGVVFYPGGPGGPENPLPPPGGGGPTPEPTNTPPPITGDPDCDDDPQATCGPGGNVCIPGAADCPGGGGGTVTTGGGGGGGGNGGDGGCRGDRNDPDGGNNGGRDEIGGVGGNDPDRDCNNGSGNDDDGEDDNNAGGKGK
jgi:prepilin-type N-terminal cleavage/methylation domain-containing protein